MNRDANVLTSTLTFERQRVVAAVHCRSDDLLGGLAYGNLAGTQPSCDAAIDLASPVAPIGTPVLPGTHHALDLWRTTGTVERGRTGDVRWWRDEEWMFGQIDVPDEAAEGHFDAHSRLAYQQLFRALAEAGRPQLLRLWNYLPRINADGGGLERYRQFNSGRHRAFDEAKRSVLDGAPAACALGTPGGPLQIRFLASRASAVPIENPRQVSAYRYPADYGPRSPTFSRAALAEIGSGQLALFISGTASIVGHQSLHVGDVQAQAAEALRNLEVVIDNANRRGTARFDLRALDAVVYVRHASDRIAVHDLLEATLGASSHTLREAVWLQADVCRAELLVEIEAHATAPGELLR